MHRVIFRTPHATTVLRSDEEYDVIVDRMRDLMYCMQNNIDTTIRIEEGAKVYRRKFMWLTRQEMISIMRRAKSKKLGMKQCWFDVEDLGSPESRAKKLAWELTVNDKTHKEYRDVVPGTEYYHMDLFYIL